ncbi:metallophosphoesterase 1 isoform X4 [Ailuropoda melanoleuca]|uniref:metallophosphoesterase 1 isoform X4 n=1 Tax=Ailuropoda melanoleuca TaxID=9646 RepID=UPI001493E3DC|nr:metallophosphoesterase 1 isoform X4 [Ailuropoda melanoleuca]
MALIRLGFGRQHFCLLKRRSFLMLKLAALVFAVVLFCEFLIYYLVIFRCDWPEVKTPASDSGQKTLKAMFLADTHLLGEVRGHWLDKLRREWQMERAFQTALRLLQPEVVFILGDIFDEGKWSSSQAWADDVERFQKIFRHPRHVQLKVVAGNHDIGFHYHFVMVNSVALEGDGCHICSEAEAELIEISRKLNCSRKGMLALPGELISPQQERRSGPCPDPQLLPASAPVLLQVRGGRAAPAPRARMARASCLRVTLSKSRQHFPLYRRSDANCSGEDAAPLEERGIPFKERYDVLSQEASQQLLWWLRPRLILSGHTHSACEVLHGAEVPEISVPSFSWRNRNNPSFIMGSMTPTEYALAKCYLPYEDTVLATYCVAAGLLVVLILVHSELLPSPFLFGWNLLRKFKTT